MADPDLTALLDLERIELNLFRASAGHEGSPDVLYGGAVAAQALHAAGRTVPPEAVAHSLHAYFIRTGDVTIPVVYRVEQDRDGRSFFSRRVVAIQRGEVILNMVCSFHLAGPGQDSRRTACRTSTARTGCPTSRRAPCPPAA